MLTVSAPIFQGTWTPTPTLVGGAGNILPVYTTNSGRYTQINNIVFCRVTLNGDGGAEGDGTGVLNISLPLTASANIVAGTYPFIRIGYARNGGTDKLVCGTISASATTVSLLYEASATSLNNFTGVDQNNTDRGIYLYFWYEV